MRSFGVTARTLHYYEAVGLLRPVRDRANARLFDADALRRLDWILVLRRAGLPISTIAALLAEDAGDAALSSAAEPLVERRRAELAAQLGALETLLYRLRERGDHQLRAS